MRYLLLLPVLFGLAGCGAASPVMISDSPIYDHARAVHHSHGVKSDKATEAEPTSHDWKLYEDRFITTHSMDASVDALHVTPDQINSRLNVLDAK